MRLIYIRASKGLPSEAAQRAALLAAGLTEAELADAYVDRQAKPKPGDPEQQFREHIVGAVREGDELWVARPGVLASTEDDALRFVARISKNGGVLCIVSTGERYQCPPEAREHVSDALRLAAAMREDERRSVLEKARSAIRTRPGRAPTPPAKLKAAEKLWRNEDLTAEEAAARAGMGVRTLYRYFGPKGTPIFGRGKKP